VIENPSGKLYCFVGPEGGFSDPECKKLEEAAFHAAFFGDTILRTETAGIYALGAVRTIVLEGHHWQLSL
jgi:16S rRNA (uracil1498-N3)-methyltransferase